MKLLSIFLELKENFKIGDEYTGTGFKTKISDINPETGKVTWDIEDLDEFKELHKKLVELEEYLSDMKPDPEIEKIKVIIRSLRLKVARRKSKKPYLP